MYMESTVELTSDALTTIEHLKGVTREKLTIVIRPGDQGVRISIKITPALLIAAIRRHAANPDATFQCVNSKEEFLVRSLKGTAFHKGTGLIEIKF